MTAGVELDPVAQPAFVELFSACYRNPALFFKSVLRVDLRAWQRDVCDRIRFQLARREPNIRVLIRTAHGSGKALALDTPLPTPSGWTTMGKVARGDFVLNEDGMPVVVLGTSDVEVKDSYRMEFDDGTSIVASADHVWQAMNLRERQGHRRISDWRDRWDLSRAVTTETIASSMHTSAKQLAWRIPCSRPLRGRQTLGLSQPYTLGFWLGDGTADRAAVTIGHQDAAQIVSFMAEEGVQARETPSQSRVGCSGYTLLKQGPWLRGFGILKNKRIPARFLRAPIATRLALLNGLMDSDGYLTRGPMKCEMAITLTKPDLFADVLELIRTFGWKARIVVRRPKGKNPNFTASFRPDIQVARLARKQMTVINPNQASRHTVRTIRAVVPVGKIPVKCLAVDSPRSLYLAGEAMIPTHNTWMSAGILLWWMTTRPEARGLTLAPTWTGVEKLLWPEVESLHRGSLLAEIKLGRMMNTEFEITRSWFAIGMSSDRPANLEGHHSKTAAIRIVDEAKAVDNEVFDATEGTLDAPETLDLWISTPSIAAGRFYQRDTDADDGTIRAKVTVDDLIAAGVPGKAEWKAECLKRWGESSFEYQSRCMAEYVSDPSGSVYPMAWIERAMQNDWTIPGNPQVAGLDPAGSVAGDETAIALASAEIDGRRQIYRVDSWHESDTMKSKGRARAIADFSRPGIGGFRTPIRVDVIGLGKGLADSLRADGYPTEVYRASDKARSDEQFVNRKAEDSWALRKRLELGTIRLPRNQKLKAQMAAIRYEITQAGKIKIVDPEDSPDLADAVLIALGSPRVALATASPDWL
jgi:LAGLIDADG-like domain